MTLVGRVENLATAAAAELDILLKRMRLPSRGPLHTSTIGVMKRSRHRVAVVGAGIKGAALAALLTVDPGVNVTLIDAGQVGGGTTAANHGRLHLGTANWRTDS